MNLKKRNRKQEFVRIFKPKLKKAFDEFQRSLEGYGNIIAFDLAYDNYLHGKKNKTIEVFSLGYSPNQQCKEYYDKLTKHFYNQFGYTRFTYYDDDGIYFKIDHFLDGKYLGNLSNETAKCNAVYDPKTKKQFYSEHIWRKYLTEYDSKDFNWALIFSKSFKSTRKLDKNTEWWLAAYILISGTNDLTKEFIEKTAVPILHNLFTNTITETLSYFSFESEIEIRRQATNAAISQVMSRNMSHNIGSHVIPYLNIKANHREFKPFHTYLQERMELIAVVGTAFPNFLKTCFKLSTLISEFKRNDLVCKGITDGKSNILFRNFPTGNGEPEFHLPGGRVGVQVIFALIESIIRNCIKHSKPLNVNGSSQMQLSLYVSEPKDEYLKNDFYVLDIVDNLGNNNIRTEETLKRIAKYIDYPIIQEGQLRPQGWGILEIKILAVLLSGASLSIIEEFKTFGNENFVVDSMTGKKYPKRLISINFYSEQNDRVEVCNASNGKNMGYRLHLLKPKIYYLDESRREEISGFDVPSEQIVTFKNAPELNVSCDFLLSDKTILLRHNYRVINSKFPDTNTLLYQWAWEQYLSGFGAYKKSTIKKIGKNNCSEVVGENDLLFDDHGSFVSSKNDGCDKGFSSVSSAGYYQPFDKASAIADFLNRLTEPIIKYQIIEACLTSVTIIDERIQAEALQKHNILEDIDKIDVFRKMGICIPSRTSFLGDLAEYIDKKDDLEDFEQNKMMSYLQERFKKGDKYVLIHHTIFEIVCEMIYKSKEKREITKLYEKIYSKFELSNKHLVLVSGRGLPSNLPNECYFLNLITLQNVILTMQSKIHLVQLLKSLRPLNFQT